jgi:glyoxylase-like metal-dependent hydrolase (beta-lactamase superfamily II)
MIYPIYCSFSNVFLVEEHEKYILIDAGFPWDKIRILNVINQRAPRLDLIYITHAHPDHYGCAKTIREITNAPIAIHQEDELLLRSGKISLGETKGFGSVFEVPSNGFNKLTSFNPPNPDVILHDGDTLEPFGIEAEIIHTPGHTPGSSSILFSNGSAFVGDLASSTGHTHIQRYFAQDWSMLFTSVQKISKRRPKSIFPGHGRRVINGDYLDQFVILSTFQ